MCGKIQRKKSVIPNCQKGLRPGIPFQTILKIPPGKRPFSYDALKAQSGNRNERKSLRNYFCMTNPIIWDCIFCVFTGEIFANLLMFHPLFLAAQFLSVKIVSQKEGEMQPFPAFFQNVHQQKSSR